MFAKKNKVPSFTNLFPPVMLLHFYSFSSTISISYIDSIVKLEKLTFLIANAMITILFTYSYGGNFITPVKVTKILHAKKADFAWS